MSIYLYDLLVELEKRNIYFDLAYHRDGYIMVLVSVPGERWEIEYSKSGRIEVEVFRSNGEIFNESMIEDLFNKFSS